MTTLITGATGAIGASLVRKLSSAGLAVRAGSRDPRQVARSEAEVVELDLTEPNTFGGALLNVDRVFLYAEPAAIDQFVESAERAGVRSCCFPRTLSRWLTPSPTHSRDVTLRSRRPSRVQLSIPLFFAQLRSPQ